MADTATLQARLDEAEDALHRLMIGASVVEVSYEDHQTKFTRADEAKLRRYIQQLKRDLGLPVASASRRVAF